VAERGSRSRRARGAARDGADRRSRATAAEAGAAARSRAVAPSVSKGLEAALVVLFLGATATTLYGGVVPDYRTAAADRVAEETVVDAAAAIERSVPPATRSVRLRRRVDLPTTIRGTTYRIAATNRTGIALRHPTDGVGARARLSLPARVRSVSGTWHSGEDEAALVVAGDRDGLRIRLGGGSA